MKKILLTLTLIIGALVNLYAQNDEGTPSTAVGVIAGGAVGAQSTAYPVALGGRAKFEYPVSPNQLSLIFTTGFTFFVSADGYSTGYDSTYGSYSSGSIESFVPVMVGARYYVNRFFFEGNVGTSIFLNAPGNGGKAAFMYSPAAGYEIPFGSSRASLDATLGYEGRLSTANVSSIGMIAVSAIFKFKL